MIIVTLKKIFWKIWITLLLIMVVVVGYVHRAHAFEWAPEGYGAQWISQNLIEEDGEYVFTTQFKNIGTATWKKNKIVFAIYKDPNRKTAPLCAGYDQEGAAHFGESIFLHESWLNKHQIGTMLEDIVLPGGIANFKLSFKKPDFSMDLFEDFSLAVIDTDGLGTWIPADAPYPDGTGDPLGVAHVWVSFLASGSVSDPEEQLCPASFTDSTAIVVEGEVKRMDAILDLGMISIDVYNVIDIKDNEPYVSTPIVFDDVALPNDRVNMILSPGTFLFVMKSTQGISLLPVVKTIYIDGEGERVQHIVLEATRREELMCIELYDPVCGVDKVTYSNSCFAANAQVPVMYKGICGEVTPIFVETPSPTPLLRIQAFVDGNKDGEKQENEVELLFKKFLLNGITDTAFRKQYDTDKHGEVLVEDLKEGTFQLVARGPHCGLKKYLSGCVTRYDFPYPKTINFKEGDHQTVFMGFVPNSNTFCNDLEQDAEYTFDYDLDEDDGLAEIQLEAEFDHDVDDWGYDESQMHYTAVLKKRNKQGNFEFFQQIENIPIDSDVEFEEEFFGMGAYEFQMTTDVYYQTLRVCRQFTSPRFGFYFN